MKTAYGWLSTLTGTVYHKSGRVMLTASAFLLWDLLMQFFKGPVIS